MHLCIILLLLASSYGQPPGDKVAQVTKLLDELNLGEYGELFVSEEIDIDILPSVTDEQLRTIGVRTLGQRIRILTAARGLQCNLQRNQTNTGGHIEAQTVPDPVAGEVQVVETGAGTEGEQVTQTGGQQGAATVGEQEDNQEGNNIQRGSEEPQVIMETLSTGRISHRILVGFDRFDRRNVAKSGLSVFHCNYPNCLSKIKARYSSYENRNNEEPEVESEPTEHLTKAGVIHPIDIGKRMREVAEQKIKTAISANPLRPVAAIHEDVVNSVLDSLETRDIREEFMHRY